MFLEFGNAMLLGTTLVAAYVSAVFVNWVLNFLVGYCLSIDSKDSPISALRNYAKAILWDKLVAYGLFSNLSYNKEKDKYCLVHDNGEYWLLEENGVPLNKSYKRGTVGYNEYCLGTKEECQSSIRYEKIDVAYVFIALVLLFVGLLLIDLAILWLQSHFLSATIVLGFGGVVLSLRKISGFLWKTMAKTKDNTDRIEKLEEKSDA